MESGAASGRNPQVETRRGGVDRAGRPAVSLTAQDKVIAYKLVVKGPVTGHGSPTSAGYTLPLNHNRILYQFHQSRGNRKKTGNYVTPNRHAKRDWRD